LTWLKEKGHCPQTYSIGKPFKLAKLPEETKQLSVFIQIMIWNSLSATPFVAISLNVEDGS